MAEHIAHTFDVQLKELATKVEELGQLAVKQVSDSIQALSTCDTALAERVIAKDDLADALQREIEQKAIIIIARRQPMAVDLREIIGSLHISNDLERVSDLAENVAKQTLQMNCADRLADLLDETCGLGQRARAQLERVLGSYRHRDVNEALEVRRGDSEIDALNTSLHTKLLARMAASPQHIAICTRLLFCGRNFERIGDHATNIAESVHYILMGFELAGDPPKNRLPGVG
jgi:phosphate transport system protein